MNDWKIYFIEFSYLFASILFVFGLKALSNPKTARRGMNMAALGMLIAVVGTLLHHDIISREMIFIGMIVGSRMGGALSIWRRRAAIPRRPALPHAFAAGPASVVGI